MNGPTGAQSDVDHRERPRRAANVADVELRGLDFAGDRILAVYAKKPPQYAVYRTADRVSVHFADAIKKRDEQRNALAQLAPVRGEINGLVDGWRSADLNKRELYIGPKNGTKLRDRAERFDRQVADALVVALEGDLTGAGALLNTIRDDAKAERVARSRVEYLITAFLTGLAVALIAAIVTALDASSPCGISANQFLCIKEGLDLWHGAIAGAAGAFFSIALAIRGRTILTDLNRTSNIVDALLRMAIGTIAGAMLVALTEAEFVRISLGSSSPGHYLAIHVLVVGFIGGFAERLVPDLLAKAEGKTGEQPVIRKPEPASPAAPPPGPASAGAGGQPPPDDGPDPIPAQADEDACIADVQISDDEATPDSALPAASGGVEADLSSEEEPK